MSVGAWVYSNTKKTSTKNTIPTHAAVLHPVEGEMDRIEARLRVGCLEAVVQRRANDRRRHVLHLINYE